MPLRRAGLGGRQRGGRLRRGVPSGLGGDRLATARGLEHELTALGLDPLTLGVFDAGARLFLVQLRLALDVDAPATQPRRQPGVLPFLADRERELEVGDDDLGGTGVLVDPHFAHPRRGQRLHHELGGVVRVRNDVDLLAAQLVDDHPNTRSARADARADRVDVAVVRGDRDLRAVAGLTGDGLQLDDAVDDLGHLELEEALHQPGVRARDHDLGTLRRLAHLDDVRLEPAAVLVPLVLHLLGLREQRLHPTEVEQGVALVGLLDDARDDVAFAAGVLLVLHLALGVANALEDHLLRRLRGDATEVLRRVVPLANDMAFLVEFLRNDANVAGLDVDLDEGFLGRARQALVRRDERVRERLEHDLDRDALLALDVLERFHHVAIHGSLRSASCGRS